MAHKRDTRLTLQKTTERAQVVECDFKEWNQFQQLIL